MGRDDAPGGAARPLPDPLAPALSGESAAAAASGSSWCAMLSRVRTPLQIVVQQLVCLLVPFGVYEALEP